MDISDMGLKLISRFEGCVLKVYNDVAGHATIGYGHLLHKGKFTDRDPQVITQQEADRLLREDAAKHVLAVNLCTHVPLLQNQFDALVSLSFNIGSGVITIDGQPSPGKNGLCGSSLVKAINSGRSSDAPEIRRLFGLWNKAGGVVNKGLVGRRHSEATVFLTPYK